MIDEMVPNIVIPANGTADKPEPATGSSGLGVTPAQESELGRLYGDTTTPTSELQELFGISEPTLFLIVEQLGIPRRARDRTRRRRKRTSTGRQQRQPFRVQFQAEAVVQARDIREALRGAEALADDIISITRIA